MVVTFFYLLLSAALAIPGMMLLTPLVMLLRYLAETERKKALKASSVKVVGVDVMASKKVTSAIVLYPIFVSFGNILLGLFMYSYTNFTYWQYMQSHFLYTILFPIYSFYCIKATDDIYKYSAQFMGRLCNFIHFDDMFLLSQ